MTITVVTAFFDIQRDKKGDGRTCLHWNNNNDIDIYLPNH